MQMHLEPPCGIEAHAQMHQSAAVKHLDRRHACRSPLNQAMAKFSTSSAQQRGVSLTCPNGFVVIGYTAAAFILGIDYFDVRQGFRV